MLADADPCRAPLSDHDPDHVHVRDGHPHGRDGHPHGRDATPLDAAWTDLWANRFDAAATGFAELAEDGDTEALQGQLLAELALGRSVEAAATLKRYLEELPRETSDFEVVTLAIGYLDLEDRELSADLADGLSRLAKDDDLDTIDRRRVLGLQQRLARAAGDRGKVRDLTGELNRITAWGVLGPFDNTSGSGHAQPFIRTAAYDPYERFDGKIGQPVRWFQPDLLPYDGSIHPSHYFQQHEYTTSYVRTAVKIPDAGEYLLSLSFAGDVEVSINDQPLADVSHEIAGPERLHWRVTLPRGWNRLAVKTSHREDGDGVALSLGNLDGSAIDDLEISVQKNAMAVMREVVAEPVTGARDDAVLAASTAAPDDPRAALWRLMLARRTLAPDDLLQLCDDLAERFPGHGLLLLVVADARRQAGATSRYEQQMQALADIAPELAIPHCYLGQRDLEKKYSSRALERARQVLEAAPNSARAHGLKLAAYQQERRWHDFEIAARKARRRLPREAFPLFALATWARELGDRKAAAEHREDAVELMQPDRRNLDRLARSFDKEDYADARKLAERLTEQVPDARGVWALYVQALLADGKVKKAAEKVDRLLENFPLDVRLMYLRSLTILRGIEFDREQFWADHPELVDALRRNRYLRNDAEVEKRVSQARAEMTSARETAAADALAPALLADPGNLALRDQIRSWRGEKPYREFFPDLDSEQVGALRVDPQEHAGREAVILCRITRNFVFDGQASLHDVTMVVQVLDQDGVEDWEVFDPGPWRRSALTYVEHEIVKADGGVEQGELFRGQVMFKGLAPGDIVHLRYQAPSIVTGKLAGHLWDQCLFADPHGGPPSRRSTSW